MTWPEFVSIGTLITVVVGAIISWRKGKTDGYTALTTALRTSGQTIGDLMLMISELPTIKQQLHEAQAQIKDLQAERQEWEIGIGLIVSQLVKLNIEPDWTPKGVNKHIKVG